MKHPPLVKAVFLRRDNRFLVTVELEGKPVHAHLPNSGRLRELLSPGREVYLTPMRHPGRKTAFDLKLVRVGQTLVSADARLPPLLLQEAIERGELPEFAGYPRIEHEPRFAGGRLDLLLVGAGSTCFVETKSVTLVEKGVALFPDAPTARGRRHLEKLASLVAQGYRAVVAFVVQRDDASVFAPNAEADPAFAATLEEVHSAGVEVRAYRCHVTLEEIRITGILPMKLR